MKKIDTAVKKQTMYIALWVIALSVVMQLVFFLIGKWDMTVLFASLLIGAAGILNFFIMGLFVQKAVSLEQKEAKKTVQVSMVLRNVMMFAFLAVAVLLPVFNTWASVITVFFPRIAIAFFPLFEKNKTNSAEGGES